MDKAELVRTMREAHRQVADAIEQLPDERLTEPVMDGWTGKDVVAHMAWWHEHSVQVIESLRAGREPYDADDPGFALDTLNERTLREHRDDPPQLVRREFNASFSRLLAALEPLRDGDLFAGDRWPWLRGEPLAETILWDSSRHYDAHREHLERLLS